MLFPTSNDFETLSFILKVSQSISLNRKNYNTNYSHAKCQHIAQLLELPIFILFLLIYLNVDIGANKTKSGEKTKDEECSPAVCTPVLFMKALPGTMETNYLLTMWNRILFTRLRFSLLFQMRFFAASLFVSHSIIVSIFQNQSVSRKQQKKEGWIAAFHKTSH